MVIRHMGIDYFLTFHVFPTVATLRRDLRYAPTQSRFISLELIDSDESDCRMVCVYTIIL